MSKRKQDSGEADSPADDKTICDVFEEMRNGAPIDWSYWACRMEIDAAQGAKLAHLIDPIKWPDHKTAQGETSNDLRARIEYLRQWLTEREVPCTLGTLVARLGENAPYNMRRAVTEERARTNAYNEQFAEQQQREQQARRDAGLYTLDEAAAELSAKDGADKDRWLERICLDVRAGKLALRNPKIYADKLPYPVPNKLHEFRDVVHRNAVNTWRAANSDWGDARLDDPRNTAQGAKPSNAKKWTREALRMLRTDYLNGATQEELAVKHKCKRQRISTLLAAAKRLDSPLPPSLAETGRRRIVKGGRY